MLKVVENKKCVEEIKVYDPDLDSKIFGANIIRSPRKLVIMLEKGNLKSVFNIVKANIDLNAITIASGIDYKTLVKYDSGYYLYLNEKDTEKLIQAINEMYIPTKLHYGLDYYRNIEFMDYEIQDAEMRKARAEHREILRERVKKMGEDIMDTKKGKRKKTGGREIKC